MNGVRPMTPEERQRALMIVYVLLVAGVLPAQDPSLPFEVVFV